jgi:hypothetical protein
MKQIPINNYLIVEVPEDAHGFEIDEHLFFKAMYMGLPNIGGMKKLPLGQWQIVQPTEETCREVVEGNFIGYSDMYRDYSRTPSMPLDTALESYHSLLKANQIENAVLLNKIK